MSSRRTGRLARRMATACAVAMFGTATGMVVLAPPAYAAACDAAESGVTMVVDFGPLGGGIDVRCASGDPSDGVVALRGAGFSVAGTTRWGDAFVCRINGLPTAAAEPCRDTPPVSAYWSYWHAPRGGLWSYSQVGARAYNPAVGTVEGWSFGTGNPPGIAPPGAPPAPPPPPPPVNPPPGDGSGSGSGSGTGGGGTEPAAPSASVDPTMTASGSATPTATGRTATASSTVDVVATAPPTGGVNGTLFGIGLVLILAAVATVVAIRRRMSVEAVARDEPL